MVDINAPLDLSDPEASRFLGGIQGDVLKGHTRDHAAHLLVRFKGARGPCRNWLHDFGHYHLTSAKNQSDQIRAFKTQGDGGTFANLAFSASGYAALGLTEVPVNTIGGTPRIDDPKFTPAYPGPLPGGVESQLTVQLAPFSMAQLETFLTIEEPRDPLQFRPALAEADKPVTIGEFYDAIIQAIEKLGPSILWPGPRNQVGPDLIDDAVVVKDVATAKQGLPTIVEQGEGTSKSPLELVGKNYAHYYRFMQIKKGHLLEPKGDTDAWDGPPVPFDLTGVYPVPTLTAGWVYPSGSASAAENDTFSYTYTNLLRALHALVNGQNPSAQMNRALGLMMSLKELAKAMMSGIPDSTHYNGPTFQYQPVSIRHG